MPVPSEPFAAVYEDRNRLGVIVARIGRGGFEAYAADDHCLGLFPTPREAAAAITTTRPWVAEPRSNHVQCSPSGHHPPSAPAPSACSPWTLRRRRVPARASMSSRR